MRFFVDTPTRCTYMRSQVPTVVPAMVVFAPAGLPASQGGEPGQVRKEAAIAIDCECRGQARLFLCRVRQRICVYPTSFLSVFSVCCLKTPAFGQWVASCFWERNCADGGRRFCFHLGSFFLEFLAMGAGIALIMLVNTPETHRMKGVEKAHKKGVRGALPS